MIFVVEKNKEYVLDIVAQGYEGEGIAKIDSYPIFISGALTEEKVRVKIIKVKKNYAYGKIEEIIAPSLDREVEKCTYYKRCGEIGRAHV